MPSYSNAVLGMGVVVPIEIFRLAFPGDLDELQLGPLSIYYPTYENDTARDVFLTTEGAFMTGEFEPILIENLNSVMVGADQLRAWVAQVFPELVQNFGLILYVYSSSN